ncbi:hypothetical protein HDU98_002790 [Podochytrium sp. JEL0797]|nr:hypothetical protein HDU98_002790 [Podochytrium sp. JEL0797]
MSVQQAPPPITTGPVTGPPPALTTSIPSVRYGAPCNPADNLVYACGWDGIHNAEIIVQCSATGQVVYVNTCAAVPGLVNSGTACVYFDYAQNGNNPTLYLPYCVNLAPAKTSKPTDASVYVGGQIVVTAIPGVTGAAAGSTAAATVSAKASSAVGGVVGYVGAFMGAVVSLLF